MFVAFRSRALLVVIIALSTWAVAVRPSSAVELNPSELGALARGQLVQRMSERRQGSLDLMGGSSWQVVDAPRDVVWSAFRDVSNYKRMLPAVSRASVVARRGADTVVRIEHELGPSTPAYHMRMTADAEKYDLSFVLDRSHRNALRAGWGFVSVHEWANDTGRAQSLVVFGCMIDPGEGVFSLLLRPRVHEWLLRIPQTVKRFVERDGRSLYARAWASSRDEM